jgi:predicted secreted protein
MVNAGSNLRLQITRDDGVTWENIPGEKVSGYTIGNEQVDTTEKTTQAANGMREMVACGVRTNSITASGVVKDGLTKDLFTYLCNAAWAQTIQRFRVMSGPYIVVAAGSFLITSFGRSGEYNGAELWNISLESAGVVTQEEAPPMPLPPLGTYDGAVAFSVRRLTLPSAYSGPCMRLRRSSDNAEQDIGFNSSGWLDETAALAFVGSGDGFMVAWYNQTPQYGVVKFIQPDATKQPRVVISGALYKVGSAQRPAIKFEGTRWLRTETENALKILTADQQVHLSSVYFFDTSADEQVIFCQQCSLGGYRAQSLAIRIRYPNNGYPYELAKTELGHSVARQNLGVSSSYPYVIPTPSAINTHRFIALNGDSQSCDFFWGGTKRATTSGLVPMTNRPVESVAKHSYIGCHIDQAAYILQCGLHEVIVMSKSWTDEETINLSLNQAGAFS